MKAFLNFKDSITMTRNGVKMTFSAISMEKGSKGVFPGISAKDFNLEQFITFQCKNIETANDKDMRTNSFNNFVVEAFNELTMAIWKDCVVSTEIEYKPVKGVEKPKIEVSNDVYETFVKSFKDSIEDLLSLVSKAREKNSVYYKKLAAELGKLFTKETDKEKKASLLTQAREALKTAKTLEEQENKALDLALLDILGEETDETTTSSQGSDAPESTKPSTGDIVSEAIKEAIEKSQVNKSK